jgi:hypothetical protein
MDDKILNPAPIEAVSEAPAPEKTSSGFWRFVLDVIETVVLSVLLFVGINAVSVRIRVDGFMEPTLG